MAGENPSNRPGVRTEETVRREETVDPEGKVERIPH